VPREHKIKQGQDISSIASQYGVPPGKIWNDPANAQLKDQRKDQNVLHPGDVLVIPDKEEKEESGETEQRHRFRRKGGARLRLRFMNEDTPLADESYVLDVDGMTREGQTDGEGWLDEPLPTKAQRGMLYLGEKRRAVPLNFATVDPVTEISGAQVRLKNLGYYSGDVSGRLDEQTADSLEAFQEKFSLEVTGELDQATQDKLLEQHGG
jgi:N-acetylmuramoyl-L-alanine amidase